MIIFGGETNPSDVSFDTANSKKIMIGSHINKQHTYIQVSRTRSAWVTKNDIEQTISIWFASKLWVRFPGLNGFGYIIKEERYDQQYNKWTSYQYLRPRKSRLLQSIGSTIYWLQIQRLSRMNHNRINTLYYCRRRIRRFLSMGWRVWSMW